MDHEDQYNQNVDLENFDFLHMVLNEKSVLQIKSKKSLTIMQLMVSHYLKIFLVKMK